MIYYFTFVGRSKKFPGEEFVVAKPRESRAPRFSRPIPRAGTRPPCARFGPDVQFGNEFVAARITREGGQEHSTRWLKFSDASFQSSSEQQHAWGWEWKPRGSEFCALGGGFQCQCWVLHFVLEVVVISVWLINNNDCNYVKDNYDDIYSHCIIHNHDREDSYNNNKHNNNSNNYSCVILRCFWQVIERFCYVRGRARPNIGFGYGFGAETAKFLVSAWFQLRP